MRQNIYHFEPSVNSAVGLALNKREVAVFKLVGFIEKSSVNIPEGVESPEQSIWSYVDRGGERTGIHSTESAEAIKAQLTSAPSSNPENDSETQTIGSVQRLFMGLHTADGAKVNREAVIEILASKLDTFSVMDVLGYYQGNPEPTLIVEVAKTGGANLEPLARDLADAFDQDAVGLENKGIYMRVFGERKRTCSKIVEDDRRKLNQFSRALSAGKRVNDLDGELQDWWLNRY